MITRYSATPKVRILYTVKQPHSDGSYSIHYCGEIFDAAKDMLSRVKKKDGHSYLCMEIFLEEV